MDTIENEKNVQYFLDLIKKSRRGKFKLYIGMIAGVGKSYRMLQEAHELLENGVDVKVGFIETHGRTGTEAILQGIPVIPRKKIFYKGKELEEMDLDAILQMRPELVIVDELAHTNVEGSRNEKRWQDVMELLDAGINVISAVNIQHIESLNEEVQEISGIEVRERIPDRVLEEADEVVNIDLTAEELIERLKAGKIYRPEKIELALNNFFKAENILQLRELALKEVALRVEKKVENELPLDTSHVRHEKFMACISSHEKTPRKIIRRCARLATRYNTKFFVLYVQTPKEDPDRISLADQRHLLNHFKLATELGGEVIQVHSPHILESIIKVAIEKQITTICTGIPALKLPKTIFTVSKYKNFMKSLSENKTKLLLSIGLLTGMIILLVSLSVIYLQMLTAAEPDSPIASTGLKQAVVWVAIIGGICIVCGVTLAIWLPQSINRPIKELTDGILEIANRNYEKRLNISDKNEEFKNVVDSFNRMAQHLAEYRSTTLSTLLAHKKFLEAIINSISDPIIGLDPDRKILFINSEALNILNLKKENTIFKSAEEISLKNDLLRKLIRELVSPNPQKEPIKIYADNKESYFKASYIEIDNTNHDSEEPEKLGHVIILKNITEFKELDSAKTTFISTISHELKTPISAIMMSLQLLEDRRIGSLNKEQEQLSQSIKENGERLLNITGELLNMTQVEAGKLQLMPKITRPIELIEYAIKANQVQADKFNIHIEVDYDENTKKLFVDSEKIAWVLTNLVSNAIRYSKENGRVIIGTHQDGNMVEIYVQDFGKGIDPRYHQSIFDRYFRVPGTKVQGSGLGLSISKDFVEAHGGTLSVESELGKGSRFILRLKS